MRGIENSEAFDFAYKPVDVSIWHLEAPLAQPRRNAFGSMNSRPALLVRVTLEDGVIGWGEIFCNWPSFAASHRSKIVSQILAPLMVKSEYIHPSEMLGQLAKQTHLVSIQAGEPGPFAQAIAGLDVAVWDALARRANQPLWRFLSNSRPHNLLPAYASGITSENMNYIVPSLVQKGWQAFKLKVGFGTEHDSTTLKRLRRLIGEQATLMVDANQSWRLNEAIDALDMLNEFNVHWVEEPIAADSPREHWRKLSENSSIALAAGENLRSINAFRSLIADGVCFLQPDPIKSGGLTEMIKIAELSNGTSVQLAPHYLGCGIGLAATAHAAEALNANWLEVDVTENALRDELIDGVMNVGNGTVQFTNTLGHGVVPDMGLLKKYEYTATIQN